MKALTGKPAATARDVAQEARTVRGQAHDAWFLSSVDRPGKSKIDKPSKGSTLKAAVWSTLSPRSPRLQMRDPYLVQDHPHARIRGSNAGDSDRIRRTPKRELVLITHHRLGIDTSCECEYSLLTPVDERRRPVVVVITF
jgi:hypothetical protein